MKSLYFFIRSTILAVIALVIGLSLSGRVLSADQTIQQEAAQGNGAFSLRPVLRNQPGLRQDVSAYSGYTRVTDNEEKIVLEVPVEWGDIDTGPWNYKGQEVGIFVAAAPNLSGFYANGSESGVFIGVSKGLSETQDNQGLLNVEKRDFGKKCRHDGRFEYKNQFYTGQYDHFLGCAKGAPGLLVFTTASADGQSLILVRIAIVNEADLEAVDRIMNTFQVLGDVERDDHGDHGH